MNLVCILKGGCNVNIHILICILILINFLLALYIFKDELPFSFKNILIFSTISFIFAVLAQFFSDLPLEVVFLLNITAVDVFLIITTCVFFIFTLMLICSTVLIGFLWAGISDNYVILLHFNPNLSTSYISPLILIAIAFILLAVILYIKKKSKTACSFI